MPYAPTNLRQTVLGCSLSLVFGGSQAWAFDAVITACHDGDTCSAIATSDGSRSQVRLRGVDAPELDQPFGTQARSLMIQLVVGRHVDMRPAGDSDPVVADLRLHDGRDVGQALVAAGAAWVEPGYSTDPETPGRQAAAQQSRLGLWRNASAVPPWQWRHAQEQVSGQEPSVPRSWSSRFWSWR
jgi:micrococcal nuclease